MYQHIDCTIAIQLGPSHLCRATALPLIEYLCRKNRLILFVPDTLISVGWFADRFARREKVHVISYPAQNSHKIFQIQKDIATLDLEVDILMLPNHSWPINQVLLELIRQRFPDVEVIVYQNGKYDTSNGAEDIVRLWVDIKSQFPRLSKYSIFRPLLRLGYGIYYQLVYFYFFIFLSQFYVGKICYPPTNFKTGRLNRAALREFNNAGFLCYFYDNVALAQASSDGFLNVEYAPHPVKMFSYSELFAIYGYNLPEPQEVSSCNIVILPSWGVSSSRAVNNDATVLSSAWLEVITLLKYKYPNYNISLKLHPNSIDDEIWARACERIALTEHNIEIIDPANSAEELILKSQVVCGDVSTALLWASQFSSKEVLSFDLFDSVGGDELASYRDIQYYDRARLLEALPTTLVSDYFL